MEENLRAHVIISGRVQGVCFRAATQTAAVQQKVTGWVRNRSDGKVEAVFEGKSDHVRAMVEWCGQGPPFARVEKVEASYPPFTAEYSDFRIVR
jgi:acylphosphatase